uniref:Uncharacterized protein n=1 Tax=Oryza meridionalis TaxID=40149 RepID=A0A0E0CPB2_9ORYZ
MVAAGGVGDDRAPGAGAAQPKPPQVLHLLGLLPPISIRGLGWGLVPFPLASPEEGLVQWFGSLVSSALGGVVRVRIMEGTGDPDPERQLSRLQRCCAGAASPLRWQPPIGPCLRRAPTKRRSLWKVS